MGNETARLPLPAILDRVTPAGTGMTPIESRWLNGHYHFQAFNDDGLALVDQKSNNPIEHSVRFRDGKSAVSATELRDLKRTKHWGRTVNLVGKLDSAAEIPTKPQVVKSKGATPVAAQQGTLGPQSRRAAASKKKATKKDTKKAAGGDAEAQTGGAAER